MRIWIYFSVRADAYDNESELTINEYVVPLAEMIEVQYVAKM